jgi:hypothetical protein
MTLAGRVQVKPAGTVSVRVTVPVSPLRAVIVMVEVADEPARICPLGDTAPAEMLKSTTWNRIDAVVWDRVPSVPVTVTV